MLDAKWNPERKRANWAVLDFRGLLKRGIAGAIQVGP